MARNELTLGANGAAEKQNNKFKDIQSILKDPLLKAKLNNLVDEAVRCKQRIYGETQAIKDLRDAARNDVMLNPKHFNYYVAMVFNSDYVTRKQDIDQLATLIDAVLALGVTDDHPGADD
jgi:hypothetical protein